MLIIFISMLRDNVPSWELHLFKKWLAFSSPMRYLHFYSRRKHIILKNGVSSRPLWGIYVSILQEWQILERIDTKFSSPMGYLHFYFGIDAKSQIDSMMFSSPMGYLYFYSYRDYVLDENGNRSRPLWGIYISIS